jgi:NAD(P)-dependent dehydrogenase (short-subunit alcohol dehydrogenase family)
MTTALITGASRGFGAAVARELATRGWDLIVDARDAAALDAEVARWPDGGGHVTAIAGDVTDAAHRDQLAAAIRGRGGLDLLLNNASTLGPSPLPPVAELDLDALRHVLETNTVAPVALVRVLLPELAAAGGIVVDVTSDAAVEPYEGWGAYGASKAALDQVTAILGAEQPGLAVYAFDPGDMRTAMHQAAFPGEDISDRPEPETVVPALLALLEQRPPSGRYTASQLADRAPVTAGGGSG